MNREQIEKLDFHSIMGRNTYYRIKYNKTADEMLESFNYKKIEENERKIVYEYKYLFDNSFQQVIFLKDLKTITVRNVTNFGITYSAIPFEIVDLILMKCAELGWIA